jgi:hypothetical protein
MKKTEEPLIVIEGENLKIRKTKNIGQFEIIDQWDKLCCTITLNDFLDWVDGRFEVMDSSNQKWVWNEYKSSQNKLKDIVNFILES